MTITALDILARILADEFLRGRRGWLRRGPRPRLMLHGIVSSFGRFGGFTQVVEHEVVPHGVREDVCLVQTGVVRRATPLMVQEMLEMDQDLRLALRV